ncbi:MAG: helix-turn-helix transcriptional regulator [Oscillospiraceae bacterium]|nr:helix-turn-helix transcriptional regulator [Oscillospiraceae bacterium]
MLEKFPKRLSSLRKERKLSQRGAAQILGVSQALLSHYENGVREPGLEFVANACSFYGVSADYIMGRTDLRYGAVAERPEELLAFAGKAALAQELAQQAAIAAQQANEAWALLGEVISKPQNEVDK